MLHISKPRVRKETEKTMRKEKRESSSTEQNDPDPTEEIGNNAIHKNDVNGKSVKMGLTMPCRGDKVCHPT